MKRRLVIAMLLTIVSLTACSTTSAIENNNVTQTSSVTVATDDVAESSQDTDETGSDSEKNMFTERDLEQEADISEAKTITLEDGEDVSITEEGVYVISGSAKNVTIVVDADENAKVQLVLDSAYITNDTHPCVYVTSADKVFVTTTSSENSLSVTGTFEADGDTNTDAVIFSKEDLVINGLGTLEINSTDNGISSKDTLKITGSTVNVDCSGSAFEAHDAINIADGTINITNCNDGLHSEDSDDENSGSIYIAKGSFSINARDDAIHATTTITVDGGDFAITAAEGIEGTYIIINDGDISITASDDGINAAAKSSKYTPTFELNDGSIKISMGQGDTDGIDSNGDIYINGGTVDITGQSTFDYNGKAENNGGTIIENGTETNTISNRMMGGHGGGMGGRTKGSDRHARFT